MDLPVFHALDDPALQASESGLLVSVVVPTRNRSRLLGELIASLWQQTLSPSRFEIIIVDNCSTDDTAELVQRLQQESPCRLSYHRMAENRGPAHPRNTGARMARAEIIAFTDSDCRAHAEWLERGLSGFAKGVAFVTGSMLDKPGQEVGFFSRRNAGVTTEHPSYPACNAFYRKEVFLAMGGFDEAACYRDFLQRPVEFADTDLAWRVKKSGYANRFVAEAIIYHEVETQKPLNWLLEPVRLFLVPELLRRHPELRKQVLRWGIFFWAGTDLFYLGVIGCVLGATVHPAFLLLAGPFLYRTAHVPGRPLSLRRIPRILARVVLLTARQLVICITFLYGSIRFRALVL